MNYPNPLDAILAFFYTTNIETAGPKNKVTAMTTLDILLADPLVLLETLTLVAILCCLAKLSFQQFVVQEVFHPFEPRTYDHERAPFGERLLRLFRVGSLVSWPKESLRGQRIVRHGW
ncbi:MAG: hypothetical protein KDD44_01295 [Bdellovibrionales bacterium]|nr:hypothetical protein [Bdellovibrionales bacterium]